MAFIIKDRVKEGTTSTGTGAVSLGGAAATFDTFQSYMSNGDTTYYAIVHTTSGVDEWEVGLGTWNTGNTLTRTTVLAGSNGTSAVNFSAGTKDIFMTYPASKAAVAGEDVTFADITVTGTVDGRDVAADGTKLDGIDTSADVTDATTVAAAGALMKSGGTMTGALILNADPTTALGAATKEYVDTIAAAGIHYHTPVRVETPSALTATYDNGTSGVGATLTNSGTQAALVIDGVTVATNDRVLVYNQTNAAHNGIYTVTDTGSASTNWVLTRATDADSYGVSDPDAFGEGDAFFVKEGDTGAGELYVMNTSGTITFGTTAINFTVIAETAVYSAGTGMSLDGTTFSIGQDVGTTDNVTFNQVTAAIIGNVTGNVTGNVSGNAGTATKLATARTVQLSGDVTGSATFDGSANINITAAVQDDSHAHVISNVDGLQTALDAKADDSTTITAGNGLTGGGSLGANRTLNVGAGGGITVSADAVAHADTSTQASVDNSGNTFIQDVTLDTYGHVTGLTSSSVSIGNATITISAGGGLQTGGNFTTNQSSDETITLAHADTSSQASVNGSGRTYIQDITLDGYGHVTAIGTATETVVNTNQLTTFVVEDGDGTEVTISHGKEWKFVEGGGIDINWTDTSTGSDGDPYDLTIKHVDTSSQASVNNSGGTVIQDVTLDTYGHVTGLGSVNLDSRYVNVTGDTMTGSLNIGAAIGTRDKTLSIDGDANSSPLVIQCDTVDNAWGVLPWSGGETYIHGGVYYDDGVWVHRSSNTTNYLLRLNGGTGAGWYASNDSTGNWNVASNVSLWNNSGTWVGAVAKSPTLTLSGDVSGSATFTNLGNATLSVTVANDSHTHDGRYYTETEANSRFVNVTGDTMTGRLYIDSTSNDKLILRGSNDPSMELQNASDAFRGRIGISNTGKEIRVVGQDPDNTNAIHVLGVGQNGLRYSTNNGGTFYKVWHQNNDGSGSGLDADTLDGSHASSFASASHTHSISTITDEHRLFNNMGNNHSTYSNFNSYGNFGARYINGGSNGPTGSGQWYGFSLGLGNEYTAGTYTSQFYWGRQSQTSNNPYIWIRDQENGSWGSWRKPYAGKADAWTTARTLSLSGDASGSVSWDGSSNATLSVTVANNSHTHTPANIPNLIEGTSFSGEYPVVFYIGSTSRLFSESSITFRGSDSRLAIDGNTVWHAGNDGSGSGLDADLLDGVQGSSFLRSDANDTFTNLTGTSLTLGGGVSLQESTDRADLLQITSSTSSWGGLQIRNSSNEGRWSFMTDGATAGFYDDENNEWAVQMQENGGVTLYHNNVANFTTGATYMEMARHLDMNNYDIYGVDQIFHHGDTNTYMQFHAADQWRVVTGGAERLEVNNSQITSTEPIHAPSFHGSGASLTGIVASARNDYFWENAQTITSNQTITNGKNAMSAGPITVNSGVTVTIGDGEAWTVV